MSTNVATSWPNRVLTYCSSMYSMDVLSYSLLFSPCFFCLHSQSYTCLFGFDSQLIFRNFIAKLSGEPSSMCRIDSGCAKKAIWPGTPTINFCVAVQIDPIYRFYYCRGGRLLKKDSKSCTTRPSFSNSYFAQGQDSDGSILRASK